MIRTTMLAVAATLIAPAVLFAQDAAPIIGRWTIEWESGRRMINDEVTVIRSTGEITVRAQGDSLVAELKALKRSDGMTPPANAMMLYGRKTASGAMFRQSNEVVMNLNGEERRQTVVSTWTLSATGDQLQGTISRELPGMATPTEPATITGTRVK